MDLQEIVLSGSSPQLSHSFDEWPTLDIAHGATKLNDTHIWLFIRVINRYPRNPLDPILNGVCEVWYNLDRPSKIVSSSLFFYDMLVDLAGGDVILSSQGDVHVAFVVSQIKVRLGSIVCDKDFAVSSPLLRFVKS
jgi:hypothetical protein